MKITITEHERAMLVSLLHQCGTIIADTLANKLLTADPANDGPEVAILNVEQKECVHYSSCPGSGGYCDLCRALKGKE
jgi:hypothetical protein